MSVFKYAISMFSRWQLLIILAIASATALGFLSFTSSSKNTPTKKFSQTSVISVGETTTPKLNSQTLTSDIPPTAVSAQLQTQPNNPGESSSQPLQSNVNINDPSLANDPLVQSLNSPNP